MDPSFVDTLMDRNPGVVISRLVGETHGTIHVCQEICLARTQNAEADDSQVTSHRPFFTFAPVRARGLFLVHPPRPLEFRSGVYPRVAYYRQGEGLAPVASVFGSC